ncbi:MAG: PTS glucitol/sorbitol transporter subunit IIA [Lactobacillus sp.]|jgi:PTS system glucitol/sorbitol-specific IIA component|nr:PTS glucitol/sorbitol transporter subunit IIA [Lactobacillus sp.]
MQVQAQITKIGNNAISAKDPMVILFGEQATDVLENVSVIQKFESKSAQRALDLKVGATIQIDDLTFNVLQVGELVKPNLTTIGHVTLIFKQPTKDDQMQNAVYLRNASQQLPIFKVGGKITYTF